VALRREPGAVETARRQLRRVRWRRNLYETQRALYLVIAVVAGAVATTILLALRLDGRSFATALAAIGMGGLAGTVAVVLACRRRWVGRRAVARWVDDRAGLDGRLATLAELAARTPEPILLPLLVEQNRERLPSWRPDVLLPESFPPLALGAAVAAASFLALVILIAPDVPPPARSEAYTAGTIDSVSDGSAPRAEPEGAGGDDTTWTAARVPASLEARIRRAAWGERWDRAREPAVRDATRVGADSPPAEDIDDAWRIAGAAGSRTGRDGGGPDAERSAVDDGRGREPGAPHERAGTDESESATAGEPAAGAGTGTDAHLLGSASAPEHRAAAFELPLAARVRAQTDGIRPPDDDAPAAAPDEHPAVADGRRRDAPVFRVAVPPAYEDAVRRLFAHAEIGTP